MKGNSIKLTGSIAQRLDQIAKLLDRHLARIMDSNDAGMRRDGLSEEVIQNMHELSLEVSAKERAKLIAIAEHMMRGKGESH